MSKSTEKPVKKKPLTIFSILTKQQEPTDNEELTDFILSQLFKILSFTTSEDCPETPSSIPPLTLGDTADTHEE